MRDLRAGDVVVLGTLEGLIELTRFTGTACGYLRWRYVHRDAKALGRRGSTARRACCRPGASATRTRRPMLTAALAASVFGSVPTRRPRPL